MTTQRIAPRWRARDRRLVLSSGSNDKAAEQSKSDTTGLKVLESHDLLSPAQIDALGLALLSLAREVWVVKDRQIVLEAFLEKNGLIGALNAYQPDPEVSARLSHERDRFAAAITDALLTKGAGPSTSGA